MRIGSTRGCVVVAKPVFRVPEAYDWEQAAACKDMPSELFYPRHYNADLSKAEAACRRCPVRQQCFAAAVETREEHGFWGGTTPRQRKKALRARSRGDAGGAA
jgi:WhiB family transcriptional regulator, redox-sensing transcriptional regulator